MGFYFNLIYIVLLLSSLWLLQFRQSQFLQMLNLRLMLLESSVILEDYYCRSLSRSRKIGENSQKIPPIALDIANEQFSCQIDVEIHKNSGWLDLCLSKSPKATNIKRYYRFTLSCPLALSFLQKDKTSLLIFR